MPATIPLVDVGLNECGRLCMQIKVFRLEKLREKL
jgi:hypothetical protein